MTTNDRTVRGVAMLSMALLLMITWGFGGIAKLFSGGVPEWFSRPFESTFLVKFPGMTASFYSIAVLEALAAGLAFASAVTGEFVRGFRCVYLSASLLLSLGIFVQLSFGKQLIGDFAGAHDLYMYFSGTLLMLLGVRWMNRSESVK